MEQVELKQLRKFERKLVLRWKIEYLLAPEQVTCRIASDPDTQTHEVWVPSVASVKPAGEHFVDAVHELCHAALAERIDPAFAAIWFSRSYTELDGETQAEFELKGRMLYWAWCHVDIWVNELMARELPDVARAERESFVEAVQYAAKTAPSALETNEGVFGLAVAIAEDRRRGRETSELESILGQLASNSRELVGVLLGIYEILPCLTFRRDEDLVALEQSVQTVALALKLPISPRLEDEAGRKVWLI